jgi:pimeloyl-ACP methyl ester carboxylesterase
MTIKKNGQKYDAAEVAYNVARPSGYILEGTLTYPSGEIQQGPVVVFLHGTISNKDHNFVPELCTRLAKEAGIRSYRFNFRFDRSEAEPEHRYRFSGYKDDVDDLECVIRQLRVEGFTPFCLFGHSRGANDALIYASTRHLALLKSVEEVSANSVDPIEGEAVFNMSRINEEVQNITSRSDSDHDHDHDRDQDRDEPVLDRCCGHNYCGEEKCNLHLLDPSKLSVVVAAPRFHMPNMLTTLFPEEKIALLDTEGTFSWESTHSIDPEAQLFVTKEDANVVLNELDMAKVVSEIPAEVPILLFHGTDDELIPVADASGGYKAARESIEVTIVEGARHAFRGKKPLKQILSTSVEWISCEHNKFFHQ